MSTLLYNVKMYKSIDPHAMGNLLAMLENLGTLSINGGELRKLLNLLKPDSVGKLMPYSGRLMRSMSVMARKEGCHSALHYFDCQQPEAVSQ